MKRIVTILLFLGLASFVQAQTDKQKGITYLLNVYQRIATKYFEDKSKKGYPKLTQEQLALAPSKRMLVLANFEGIKRDTMDKFYLDSAFNLQEVQDFIEFNYKESLKDLPQEFYKEVNEELKKG
jgi:hypothetical protein